MLSRYRRASKEPSMTCQSAWATTASTNVARGLGAEGQSREQTARSPRLRHLADQQRVDGGGEPRRVADGVADARGRRLRRSREQCPERAGESGAARFVAEQRIVDVELVGTPL